MLNITHRSPMLDKSTPSSAVLDAVFDLTSIALPLVHIAPSRLRHATRFGEVRSHVTGPAARGKRVI